MRQKQFIRRAATLLGAGFGLSVGSYAVYAGATWLRYGRPRATDGEDSDRLLDVFLELREVDYVLQQPHLLAGRYPELHEIRERVLSEDLRLKIAMAAWHQGGKEVPILKFLVAGGAGFIGSNLCETLVNRGDEVVCIDNLVTGRLENIASLLALPATSTLLVRSGGRSFGFLMTEFP